MSRIMGIDYGTKRTGIAVTDPLQIIASGLTTIHTKDVFDFLADYLKEEEVEKIVVGMPTHADGNPVKITPLVIGFVRKIKKQYPHIEVDTQDERYSSVRAEEIISKSGYKKKKRHEKALVDKIAAALILEDYLKSNGEW
ncbi:MAG: Holliday junction resolvase RuvX [Bacteroidota bacterium]